MDYSILQQEEREWLIKAIIDNNGKKGQRKESSGKNWKLKVGKDNKIDIVCNLMEPPRIILERQEQAG